jgi:hypothetical protein
MSTSADSVSPVIALAIDCLSEADALEENVSRVGIVVLGHKVCEVFRILFRHDLETLGQSFGVNVEPPPPCRVWLRCHPL